MSLFSKPTNCIDFEKSKELSFNHRLITRSKHHAITAFPEEISKTQFLGSSFCQVPQVNIIGSTQSHKPRAKSVSNDRKVIMILHYKILTPAFRKCIASFSKRYLHCAHLHLRLDMSHDRMLKVNC